jgi:methionyl-tRNA formyltransferase
VRIHTFGDPVLRRPATPVKRIGAGTRHLAAQMLATMRRSKGVGLACPQVGVSSRMIVVDVGGDLHVLVNPKIVTASGLAVDWEGCLSFPGLLAEVERAETIEAEGQGLDGRPVWIPAEGFLARVLQHEIDHLDGIVILDRAKAIERIEAASPAEVAPGSGAGAGPEADTHGRGPEADARGLEPEAGEALAEDEPTLHPLRVVFMGTPDFARPTLEALMAAGHSVVGVVTQPDRPAGRGGKLVGLSAVKRTALVFGLPIWQGTAKEARRSLASVIRGWGADVGVVVAYGVILPPEVLASPRLGCVNLHASLLPDYRGAAPIPRAILDGRGLSGVTVIKMDEGVDTGDILAQREIRLDEDETAGSLHDRLASVGAALVVRVVELLASGRAAPRRQPLECATPAPRLGREDEIVDWRKPAEVLVRQVRALSPAPGAHATLGGRRIKIWSAEVWQPAMTGSVLTPGEPSPGEIVALDGGSPVVATGRGNLVLRVVQPAGGSRMPGSDFVNGYRVKPGDRFDRQDY